MIVTPSLFRVAARTRESEVFEVVRSSVIFGDDVLERGLTYRGPVEMKCKLAVAMDTPSFEDRLAPPLLLHEGAITQSREEQQSVPATRGHDVNGKQWRQ